MDTPGRFRAYTPNQLMLLPPDLRDWLPKNHTAYFILVGRAIEALLARDRTDPAGPELAPSTDEGRRTGSGEMAPQ